MEALEFRGCQFTVVLESKTCRNSSCCSGFQRATEFVVVLRPAAGTAMPNAGYKDCTCVHDQKYRLFCIVPSVGLHVTVYSHHVGAYRDLYSSPLRGRRVRAYYTWLNDDSIGYQPYLLQIGLHYLWYVSDRAPSSIPSGYRISHVR